MSSISEEEDLSHSGLSFLENLGKYTFDSKMCFCQLFASRIMSISSVKLQNINESTVMPWELEVFVTFAVVYDDDSATEKINEEVFSNMITLIRNYWHPELELAEKNSEFADVFMLISQIQQFSVQGPFLQKLFRYHYIFNFKNENIDMMSEFRGFFKTGFREFEIFAFILFVYTSLEGQERVGRDNSLFAISRALKIKEVFNMLCIDCKKYREELKQLYKGNVLDYYYGLKVQYWYPIIEGESQCYIPTPYLVINAATESLINRLTLKNAPLRRIIGKDVLENYLFSIYSELPTVSKIRPEFKYYIGAQEMLTPDVIAEESGYAIFFDTKAHSPSLKMRKFDKEEITKETKIYAEDIIQLYKRILDYEAGRFCLDNQYILQNIFGVVAVFEDAAIARHLVYNTVFELLEENHLQDSQETRNYINSHIKIVPMRQIEEMVFAGNSYLQCLLKQVNQPEQWNDSTFFIPTGEDHLIPSLEAYCTSIKKEVQSFLE